MLLHPDSEYTLHDRQHQELVANAARYRFVAARGTSQPARPDAAWHRLGRASVRVAAMAWSNGRARRPVPQA